MIDTILCFPLWGNPAQAVLLDLKKRGIGAGKYYGFGGKSEPGERIETAVICEFKEESGLTITETTAVGTGKPQILEENLAESEEELEKLWRIIAHDDPITTMEFVVRIMVQIFKKPVVFAEMIMWQVHTEGQSVVDILPKAEAEFRVRKATTAARLEGFPFHFTLEPLD